RTCLQGERAFFMDTVHALCSGRGEADGYVLPDQLANVTGGEGSASPLARPFFQCARSRFGLATRNENIAKFDELLNLVTPVDDTVASDAKIQAFDEDAWLTQNGSRYVIVGIAAPTLSKFVHQSLLMQEQLQVTHTLAAIELFHAIHQRYPQSL